MQDKFKCMSKMYCHTNAMVEHEFNSALSANFVSINLKTPVPYSSTGKLCLWTWSVCFLSTRLV